MLIPVYVFPAGMGDAVMALAVAENYYVQTGKPLHVGHKCAEIFEHDPRVVCHPEYAFWNLTAKSEEEARAAGYQLISLFYFNFRQVTSNYWISYGASGNLVATLCSQVGLSGYLKISPRMILTEEERALARLANGKIVVIASGVVSYKSWGIEKMQAVVDACPTQSFIQVGMPSDPLLQNVEDMRGKYSLRQLAGILSGARLFLGPVGGMMHLARSVDCPALVLLPSFESSNWLYSEFDYVEPANRCMECDRRQSNPGSCTYSSSCLDIEAEQVITHLRKILASPARQLKSEILEVAEAQESGLDLYKNVISALPNQVEVRLYSSEGILLSAQKLQLDERIFSMDFSVDFSKTGAGVLLTFPRNFQWLYEILTIKWGNSCRINSQIQIGGCLQYCKSGHRRLYPKRALGKIFIPIPRDSNNRLTVEFSCIAWEHLFSNHVCFWTQAWRLRFIARLHYNIERLWDALWHDSWPNLFRRSKNALYRWLEL